MTSTNSQEAPAPEPIPTVTDHSKEELERMCFYTHPLSNQLIPYRDIAIFLFDRSKKPNWNTFESAVTDYLSRISEEESRYTRAQTLDVTPVNSSTVPVNRPPMPPKIKATRLDRQVKRRMSSHFPDEENESEEDTKSAEQPGPDDIDGITLGSKDTDSSDQEELADEDRSEEEYIEEEEESDEDDNETAHVFVTAKRPRPRLSPRAKLSLLLSRNRANMQPRKRKASQLNKHRG